MAFAKEIKALDDDPDYVFINVNIPYNNSYGNAPAPAITSLQLNTPLIQHMENFYLTIGRASIPSLEIPMLTALLNVGSAYSANEMIYSFTLSYDSAYSSQTFVTWLPTNTSALQPSGTVQSSLQSQYPYYYCYSFYKFVEMLNAALSTAFTELDGATTLPGSSAAPYFYFDPVAYTLVLVVQKAQYATNATKILIHFNNESKPLFVNFPSLNLTNNSTTGLDNVFDITNVKSFADATDTTNLYVKPFSYNPAYMNTVSSLQVLTNLPVVPENVEVYNPNYAQQSTLDKQGIFQPVSNIITDFEPDFSGDGAISANFIYNKDSTWRYCDINGSGPIIQLNLSLTWTDKSNYQSPIYLLPGIGSSIKLGFFKKSLLNSESQMELIKFKQLLAK